MCRAGLDIEKLVCMGTADLYLSPGKRYTRQRLVRKTSFGDYTNSVLVALHNACQFGLQCSLSMTEKEAGTLEVSFAACQIHTDNLLKKLCET